MGSAALVLVLVLSQLLARQEGGLALLKWYFPFFLAGYVSKRHTFRISWLWTLPLAVAFLPLGSLWERHAVPEAVTQTASKLAIWHFSALASSIPGWYHDLTAFAGIALVFVLFRLVKDSKIVVAVFGWLGVHSLVIYCAEFFFLGFGLGSGVAYVLTHSLIAIVAAITLGAILSQFWLTRLLFLGTPKVRSSGPQSSSALQPEIHS
jgi:hypothetical protein